MTGVDGRDRTRARIVEVAARLLATGGPRRHHDPGRRAAARGAGADDLPALRRQGRACSTRSPSTGSRSTSRKTALRARRRPGRGPARGWDLHVGFGLANPALSPPLMYGEPRPGRSRPPPSPPSDVLRAQVRADRRGRPAAGQRARWPRTCSTLRAAARSSRSSPRPRASATRAFRRHVRRGRRRHHHRRAGTAAGRPRPGPRSLSGPRSPASPS